MQQQQMLQVQSSLSAVSLSSSGILLPNEPRLCSGSVCTSSHYAPLHFQQRQLNANVPHIYINGDMKLTLWTSKQKRPADRRLIKCWTGTSFLFGCHTYQERSMYFSKGGTLQVQDEHMWPLNIYRDSEKERERERKDVGGKLTAKYNII